MGTLMCLVDCRNNNAVDVLIYSQNRGELDLAFNLRINREFRKLCEEANPELNAEELDTAVTERKLEVGDGFLCVTAPTLILQPS